jgi:predicted peptidase
MFAAAFAICGANNPETAEFVMQTPLWILHNTKDTIIPVERSKNINKIIVELDGQ